MLAVMIRAVVAAAVSLFYRLERRGVSVPPGAALLAANHPNSLLDPILLFATAGRVSRPLARAPLFERPVIGRLIRAVGGIPVYRREDDPSLMGRNQDTFRAAVQALGDGAAIQIFPEGRSHSDPALSPLRTGAARMALAAEVDRAWRAGVVIVPVGLTYVRKDFFRGRAVAVYGTPIFVAGYREEYEVDPHGAARALTEELDRRLRGLTLDLAEAEDIELIDTAERIWSQGKGVSASRQRVPLGDRLPRLQAFARGLAWLRVHDPERHGRLARSVRRYRREATLLGAVEGDVPDRYRFRPSLRWIGRRAVPVLLLTPIAGLALAAWWIPYRLVGLAVERKRLPDDQVATHKLAGSLLAYPLFLGIWLAVALRVGGGAAALAAAVVLPALGVLVIRWVDGFREVREDLRLFGRVTRRRQLGERLADQRQRLLREFDQLWALVEGASPTARR